MSIQSAAAINIRDYFLDNNPKEYSKAASSYDVVLQNNTDFVVSRKSEKSERELVILISKGLFYFKDIKGGKGIEEVTLSKLKAFLRDLRDGSIELGQVLWLPELSKYTIERMERIISADVFIDMCRHNVLTDVKDPGWYARYWEQNQKLFVKLHSIFPTITDNNNNKHRSSLPVIFEIEKRYGYNEAMFFAETILLSGIGQFTPSKARLYYNYENGVHMVDTEMKSFFLVLGEPYSLNLRRLIEYIFYDAYSQGFSKIDETFWSTYEDCLNMQIKIYGTIREKYPKSLKTEHDIMALKVNVAEMVAKCEDFAARSAEIADLAYAGKIYSIIVPNAPRQLADEGINLGHCVGGYVDRIINGECHILFLRKTRTPDDSLVTLQLCQGRINQAEGSHHRRITEEERKFLQSWGLAKNIEIAV